VPFPPHAIVAEGLCGAAKRRPVERNVVIREPDHGVSPCIENPDAIATHHAIADIQLHGPNSKHSGLAVTREYRPIDHDSVCADSRHTEAGMLSTHIIERGIQPR